MINRVVLNETSYFGRGSRNKLGEELRTRGHQKVLIVSDYSLMEAKVTEKVIDVVSASSATTSRSDMLSIIRTFAVSLICTFLKYKARAVPSKKPIAMPRTIETGMLTKLMTDAPSPCSIPTKVENNTITYTSSTEAPANIS